MLDQIKIAAPCSADWEQMEGDNRVRLCGECKKNIFNLSAMTRRDAEALLKTDGDICARLYRRAASDLNQAQTFVTGAATVRYLNDLVARCYLIIHAKKDPNPRSVLRKLVQQDRVPRVLRRRGVVLLVGVDAASVGVMRRCVGHDRSSFLLVRLWVSRGQPRR